MGLILLHQFGFIAEKHFKRRRLRYQILPNNINHNRFSIFMYIRIKYTQYIFLYIASILQMFNSKFYLNKDIYIYIHFSSKLSSTYPSIGLISNNIHHHHQICVKTCISFKVKSINLVIDYFIVRNIKNLFTPAFL